MSAPPAPPALPIPPAPPPLPTTPLPYAPVLPLPPRNIARGILLGPALLTTAWLIGALTNLINGLVCPDYFNRVMGFGQLHVIVAQGVFESSAFGLLLALVIVPTYCALTGCRLPLYRLAPTLALTVPLALLLHLLGGLVGYTLARFSPHTFTQAFPPSDGSDNLPAFAYVGGAIWGTYAAGVLALPLLLTSLIRTHRRQLRGTLPRNP